MRRGVSTFLACLLFTGFALALGTDTPLPDPAQEARARALFHQVRCVVCQSEAIADSPAEVARDMRGEIRKRIESGESDEVVLDYLVSRYGDFILMRPPVKAGTALLWAGPLIMLSLAGIAAAAYFRRGRGRVS